MFPLSDDESNPAAAEDHVPNQTDSQDLPPTIKKATHELNTLSTPDVLSASSGSDVHLSHSPNTIKPFEHNSLEPESSTGNTDEFNSTSSISLPPAVVTFSPEPNDSELNKASSLGSTPTFIDKPAAAEVPSSSLDSIAVPSVSASSINVSSEKSSQASVIPQQTPGVVVNSNPTVSAAGSLPLNPKKPRPKGLKFGLIALIAVVILGGGSAAAYFGYYMNPSVIWSQSMANMNAGYNKLTSYANKTSATHYKGVDENGSFQLQTGGTNYSGSLDVKSDGSNATVSVKADIGIANLDLEGREITAPGNSTPDIYLQLSGINDLGSYLNSPLGQEADRLNGQWIEIDHNLLADIEDSLVKQQEAQAAKPQLTWSEIYSFMQTAGKLNQEYLFTTNSNTSVTKVIKDYGTASVNGHNTYHYEVGFVPAHAEAYVTAMCSALQQSDIGSYLKQETGESVGSSSVCTNLESGAAKIKSSDTIGVWVDTDTRLIYQVQVATSSNPAEDFADIGLNYKGGNTYPFFFDGSYQDGSTNEKYNVTASFNEATNAIALSADLSSTGSQQLKLTSSFVFTPSNAPISLKAPTGAEPVTTILDNLGFGSYVTQLEGLSGDQLTNSSVPKADLSAPNALLLSSLINSGLNLNNSTLKD